jgi:hypothetical protein
MYSTGLCLVYVYLLEIVHTCCILYTVQYVFTVHAGDWKERFLTSGHVQLVFTNGTLNDTYLQTEHFTMIMCLHIDYVLSQGLIVMMYDNLFFEILCVSF